MDKARGCYFAAVKVKGDTGRLSWRPLFHCRRTDVDTRAQSSQLAVFGGLGMSFNVCRGTLGSLTMFTAIRNARRAKANVSPKSSDINCRWADIHMPRVPELVGHGKHKASEEVTCTERGTDTSPSAVAGQWRCSRAFEYAADRLRNG